MRKLAWAALGFAAAAFAAEYFLPVKGLPFIAAALFGLNILCFFLIRSCRNSPIFQRIFLVVLMFSVGLMVWWGHYMIHIFPCEKIVGQETEITARLIDYPEQQDGYTRLIVRVLDGAPCEKAELSLYDDELQDKLCPGDEFTVTVSIRSSLLRSGEKYCGYIAKNHNLIGTMISSPVLIGHWRFSWLYFPQRLAHAVKDTIAELFSGDTAIFLTALMTGDTGALYEDLPLYNSLRLAGVMHIVAVSGMHVSILVGSIQLMVGKKRRNSWICITAVLLFVFMSGCRASVVRAAVMEGFILIAPVLKRESDGITSLMAALLLLLLINPMSIGGIGLQLSFLCMLGYIILPPLFAQRSRRDAAKQLRLIHFRESLISSYCASCFSAVPSAYYFDIISLVSPVSNLLTLPVVSICFAGGYLVCIIYLLCRPLAAAFASLLTFPIQWCLLVYRILGKLPISCLYRDQPAAIGVYLTILILLFFILIPWKKIDGKGKISLGSACIILLCGLILMQGRKLRHADAQLAVLDVGQGQCVVLAEKDHAVVIGCGNISVGDAGDVAANFLLSEGISRIDALILPQADESYADGAEMLLSRIETAEVILPGDHLAEAYSDIASAVAGTDTGFVEITDDRRFSTGDITCTLVYLEDKRIAVIAELNDRTVLIMSGADEVDELELLSGGWLGQTDILVAGDFGSENSSSKYLLDTIDPDIAVLSVGYNRFYLPDSETISRLRDCCAEVHRTDEEGNYILYFK